jgi:hypothetical protein
MYYIDNIYCIYCNNNDDNDHDDNDHDDNNDHDDDNDHYHDHEDDLCINLWIPSIYLFIYDVN